MLDQVAGALGLGFALLFYGVTVYHLVLIFLGLRLTRGYPPAFEKGSLRNPVDLPSVSIIIPARDEEAVIEGALRCADALDYPRDLLEIIVVEDGSTDATPGIICRLQPEVRNLVALTGGESKGKPAALNRALQVAKGDVIALFDSDTRYDRDLLLRMAKFLHDHPDVAVAQAFPEVMDAGRNLLTKLTAFEMIAWFRGMQATKCRRGLFVHLAGTGTFVRRAVFDRLGPWPEDALTEDLDFSLRVARAGLRVGMIPASVRIQPTYSVKDFLRQRKRWWGGALQTARAALQGTRGRRARIAARLDAAAYLSAPLLFFLGSIMFYVSAAYVLLRADFGVAVAAWTVGILSSNIILAPLVVAQAMRTRKPSLLLLLPGLYAYWLLQLGAFVWALGSLGARSRIPWVRTPKRNLD